MEIRISFTQDRIPDVLPRVPDFIPETGAWLEFRGVIRGTEDGKKIRALRYEIYETMADKTIREICLSLEKVHPCHSAIIIHRYGIIPVGETAIYVGVASKGRHNAIVFLSEFMDLLKKDVPIWKVEALKK